MWKQMQSRVKELITNLGPDVKYEQVRDEMEKDGMEVSNSTFYKYVGEIYGKRSKNPRKPATKKLKTQLKNGIAAMKQMRPLEIATVPVSALHQIKDLAGQVGGIQELRTIIDVLADLSSN